MNTTTDHNATLEGLKGVLATMDKALQTARTAIAMSEKTIRSLSADSRHTTKAYKLMKIRRNGTLGPLFINARAIVPVGEWLPAEAHATPGFAFRPGWHCCFRPVAPHLSEKGRAWVEVEVEQFRTYDRPESQGGAWILAERMKVNRVLEPHEVEALRA